MSAPYPHLAHRAEWERPSAPVGRARERLLVGLGALIPLALALAISIEMPKPSVGQAVVMIGITLGVAAVVALVLSTRYAVTLTLLVLYLGLLEGPIKLEHPSRFSSGIRDVLILAIVIGMLARLTLKRERVTLPPLSAWPLAFVAVVVVEALNPDTHGALKVIGGYRQLLEFVPLFFFGYLIMRSKRRFRQLFLLFGVIALANGVVGAYQSRLSPAQLASWGSGYGAHVHGNGHGLSGRTYVVEGVGHPRAPALGSDSGFGGGAGLLALPGLLALLAAGRMRRRWPAVLCCLGALLGIASSASRQSTVILVVSVLVFALLWVIAGLGARRAIAWVATVAILTTGVVSVLVAVNGSAVIARQAKLLNPRVKQGAGLEVEEEELSTDGKLNGLSKLPPTLTRAPFGLGLGRGASASGFGGREKLTIEEERITAASAYNLLAVEAGAPGLLLWIGFALSVIALGVSRLRRVADRELRIYLVAILTTFIAFTIQGFSGPTLAVTPAGAYLWFAPGVLAYWLAGEGFAAVQAGLSSRTVRRSSGMAGATAGSVT
ncbi:MAG TPA: hypothetical protein VMB51_14575 [Solirubrobacteraceae bacterium]|nr:hypothetical protein [Solirubrobacteraceae bacterium]